jgi:hypothetical protein
MVPLFAAAITTGADRRSGARRPVGISRPGGASVSSRHFLGKDVAGSLDTYHSLAL